MKTQAQTKHEYWLTYRSRCLKEHRCVRCGAPATHGIYCDDCIVLKREDAKNYYQKRVAEHKCPQCGKIHNAKTVCCEECARKSIDYSRELRALRKSLNLCRRCGRKPALAGKSVCEDCIKKDIDQKNRMRRMWEEQGLCLECGKRPPENGRKRCAECIQRERDNRQKRIAERKAKGLCIYCGKEKAVKGKVACWACQLYRNQEAHGYSGRMPLKPWRRQHG